MFLWWSCNQLWPWPLWLRMRVYIPAASLWQCLLIWQWWFKAVELIEYNHTIWWLVVFLVLRWCNLCAHFYQCQFIQRHLLQMKHTHHRQVVGPSYHVLVIFYILLLVSTPCQSYHLQVCVFHLHVIALPK